MTLQEGATQLCNPDYYFCCSNATRLKQCSSVGRILTERQACLILYGSILILFYKTFSLLPLQMVSSCLQDSESSTSTGVNPSSKLAGAILLYKTACLPECKLSSAPASVILFYKAAYLPLPLSSSSTRQQVLRFSRRLVLPQGNLSSASASVVLFYKPVYLPLQLVSSSS